MKHRFFIAINIPDDIKIKIDEVLNKLRKFDWPVKWEPQDKLHITLNFLGSVNNDELSLVKDVIKQEIDEMKSFEIVIDGFLLLPDLKRPRIICLDVEENSILLNLQSILSNRFEGLNIGLPEKHIYNPHITIGKSKPTSENYNALIKTHFGAKFEVKSIEIMSSQTNPSGSVYSTLESYNI